MFHNSTDGFRWPGSCRGAISLSFDDGLWSQQKIAIPALNERGFRATFYLNPLGREDDPQIDIGWRERLELWIPVQKAGHEIGNHSLRHPCSLNIKVDWREGINLLDWTLEQMEADILVAQERISEVFPSQKATSFGYPCYESSLGRGEKRVSYTPLIARRFVAARAKGELQGSLANDPMYCDLHHLSSWAVERQSGAFLIGLAELAAAYGRWGIYTFHGIQEGHLPVGDTDLIELLDHLDRRRDVIWTAPVAEVGRYISTSLPAVI